MLFFLFPEADLKRLFEQLGYEYTDETARKNINYYAQRTSHGSTLSYVVHAAIMAEIDPESSWERYKVALESDIGDVQGGTTSEAIHMGVMAGTLDLLQRGYMGSEIRDGVICFKPKLTDKLEGLSFSMRFRDTPMDVKLEGGKLTVAAEDDGASHSIHVGVGDTVEEIKVGGQRDFDL
jgi:trehalose/maltose hydrolase-like predicted phosphorylase